MLRFPAIKTRTIDTRRNFVNTSVWQAQSYLYTVSSTHDPSTYPHSFLPGHSPSLNIHTPFKPGHHSKTFLSHNRQTHTCHALSRYSHCFRSFPPYLISASLSPSPNRKGRGVRAQDFPLSPSQVCLCIHTYVCVSQTRREGPTYIAH